MINEYLMPTTFSLVEESDPESEKDNKEDDDNFNRFESIVFNDVKDCPNIEYNTKDNRTPGNLINDGLFAD